VALLYLHHRTETDPLPPPLSLSLSLGLGARVISDTRDSPVERDRWDLRGFTRNFNGQPPKKGSRRDSNAEAIIRKFLRQ